MKKVTLFAFTLLTSILLINNVFASTNNSILLNYIKTPHAGITLSASDQKKCEDFIAENDISDEQAEEIVAIANEIVDIIERAGVKDYTMLSAADKDLILKKASDAAAVIGATLTYDNADKTILIKINGRTYDFSLSPYLKQTGKNNVVMLVSLVSVAVLAGTAPIIKKKNA